MRSINQKTIFWILITLSLTLSTKIIDYSISNSEYENEADLETSTVSGKIYVDGNSGWLLLKSTGTCTGTGTHSNPYIIKDLEIDGGGSGSCIYIRFSDVYFKIENCTLYNSGGGWGDAAIKLIDSVSNGQVINNTIYDSFKGIYLWDSFNLNISRNSIFYNDNSGIFLIDCHNILFSENDIISNGFGMFLRSSGSNDILENDISDNYQTGLALTEGSDNNFISGNVFDHDEIKISVSSRNVISWNTITNAQIGIYIDAISLCNEVSNNFFSGNGKDIQDNQGICPDFPLDLGNLLLIVLIIGISSVTIIGIIISRKRSKRKIPLISKEIRDYPIKKEMLKEVEVTPLEETLQEEEIIEVNLKHLEELPIEEEIKEDAYPHQEGKLTEEVLEMEKKPDKKQIIEETSSGSEERIEKEVFIPKEAEIKEKMVVNEVETIKEEITEKIKITAIICRYCSFKNEDDANYCVQCGQAITR